MQWISIIIAMIETMTMTPKQMLKILFAIFGIMKPTLAHGPQAVLAGEGAQDWRRMRDVAQTAPTAPEMKRNIKNTYIWEMSTFKRYEWLF